MVNDDGIEAPGLEALARALGELPGVRLALVAPMKNRTGSGTQIDFGPLTVLEHAPVAGWPAWMVDGSPLDAVSVGIQGLFREQQPDLVVSGVNQGLNLGALVLHSGTIGAAIRAVMLGVPALAVSCQATRASRVEDFGEAAHLARRLLASWLEDGGLPMMAGERLLLSLNVPRGYNGIVRWTRQGNRYFRLAEYRRDPDGVTYHPVLDLESLEPHAREAGAEPPDTDVGAVARGCASLTPLHTSLFAADAYARLLPGTEFPLPPTFPVEPPAEEDRISLPPDAEVREG
ncbi:MAG: 5'/3'-nucleotidase SurE [Dehalococcoidia bacterium]